MDDNFELKKLSIKELIDGISICLRTAQKYDINKDCPTKMVLDDLKNAITNEIVERFENLNKKEKTVKSDFNKYSIQELILNEMANIICLKKELDEKNDLDPDFDIDEQISFLDQIYRDLFKITLKIERDNELF
jgi:signal recognition particle GTPase